MSRYNPPATPVPAGAAAEEKSALLHSTIVSVWKKKLYLHLLTGLFFNGQIYHYHKLFSSSESKAAHACIELEKDFFLY